MDLHFMVALLAYVNDLSCHPVITASWYVHMVTMEFKCIYFSHRSSSLALAIALELG